MTVTNRLRLPHPYTPFRKGAQIEINVIFNVAVGGGGVLWLHPLLRVILGICFLFGAWFLYL